MQKTDEQLSIQAQEIRNETEAYANTAHRVGNMLQDLIDSKTNNDNTGNLDLEAVLINGSEALNENMSVSEVSVTKIIFRAVGHLLHFYADDTLNNTQYVRIPNRSGVMALDSEITVTGIDLTAEDYTIINAGIYEVTTAGAFGLAFPDPTIFNGQSITIINTDSINAPIADVNIVLFMGRSVYVDVIGANEMWVFKAINGVWRGGRLQ